LWSADQNGKPPEDSIMISLTRKHINESCFKPDYSTQLTESTVTTKETSVVECVAATSAWLEETEVPVEVQQKLMRHADIATTMNQYGDTGLTAKRTANSKVVEMVLTRRSSFVDFSPNADRGAVSAP
jgi:integrase